MPKRGAFNAFDYQQVEPRFFAYYVSTALGDTTVADWFREERDFYTEVAALIFDKLESEITKEERQHGKTALLAILYGAGPKKIAEQNGMTLKEGRAFYAQFHASLPWIKRLSNPPPSGRGWDDYQPGLIERVLKNRGYLKTPWGRRLHKPQFGEHRMLNTLIQGSSADLMKQAITRVAALIRASQEYGYPVSLESRLVLTVHDELVLDGPEYEIEELHDQVPALMIDERIDAVVPLGVDHEISTSNLAEKEPYEEWQQRQRSHGPPGSSKARAISPLPAVAGGTSTRA